MFPTRITPTTRSFSLPRARGDVSSTKAIAPIGGAPSPRTRGCFSPLGAFLGKSIAFPAHAGMFLSRRASRTPPRSLPRARGDVSDLREAIERGAMPSPRTRGCFSGLYALIFGSKAFPAHAGMFLVCVFVLIPHARLPRARGDVSTFAYLFDVHRRPSPRTRGCFSRSPRCSRATEAFPAHAGMFPRNRSLPTSHVGLPRARGDCKFFPDRT